MPEQICIVGLGRMGLNVALLLAEKKHMLRCFDRDANSIALAGRSGLATDSTLEALLAGDEQKVVLLFVPEDAVDPAIQELQDSGLNAGDFILDCGNSHYRESIRRHEILREKSIRFLDVGTSGGVSGARSGPCLTVGGKPEDYNFLESFLRSFSSGLYFGGSPGAGHFIKTIHNGIEYGFLQALAEGLAVLEASSANGEFQFDLAEICRVWNQGSIIASRLTADAALALAQDLPTSGQIGGGQTGGWALASGQEKNVLMPVLQAALRARATSMERPDFSSQLVARVRHVFGQHELS